MGIAWSSAENEPEPPRDTQDEMVVVSLDDVEHVSEFGTRVDMSKQHTLLLDELKTRIMTQKKNTVPEVVERKKRTPFVASPSNVVDVNDQHVCMMKELKKRLLTIQKTTPSETKAVTCEKEIPEKKKAPSAHVGNIVQALDAILRKRRFAIVGQD